MSSDISRLATRGITWIVPFLIAAAAAYTTYTTVAIICIDFLIDRVHDAGLAVAFLVLHFVFLFCSTVTYIRVFWAVKRSPDFVPLFSQQSAASDEKRGRPIRIRARRAGADDVERQTAWQPPDLSADSPGLERFYSKDVFVCEGDGRPKWCHDCLQWKPDRAHHSSELGCCIYKMDHFCPWVGGVVSETSFKFFTQFTVYAAFFCAVVLASHIYCLVRQIEKDVTFDGRIIAGLVLAAFFGLFSTAMSLSSFRFISVNMTNIDMLKNPMTYFLAIRVPLGTPSTDRYYTVTYPLPRGDLPSPRGAGMGGVPPVTPTQERDRLARRTFAVLKTEPGENPWHLGFKANWRDIMGPRIIDFFLPIKPSPCTLHESATSEYLLGPLIDTLRERYNLPKLEENGHIAS